jgi:hypothetical protein
MQKILTTLLSALILTSCAIDNKRSNPKATTSRKPEPPANFAQFKDIPIPENAKMDLDRTLLFGGSDAWIGRLYFTAPYNAAGIFDFYMAEMPIFGWNEITAVRAEQSKMTYKRGNRIATIEIRPSSASGSAVSFTVSPYKMPKFPNSSPKKPNYMSKSFNEINPQAGNIEGISEKSNAGSLKIGDASNVFHKSKSKGVGAPPPGYQNPEI